jgi:hypothetical protein
MNKNKTTIVCLIPQVFSKTNRIAGLLLFHFINSFWFNYLSDYNGVDLFNQIYLILFIVYFLYDYCKSSHTDPPSDCVETPSVLFNVFIIVE